MVTTKSKAKLVAIVGPTASGKSDLAMKIAKEFNGEIICADSRTIYKGMNIGTAKPSAKDRKEIRHWGLDLVEPGQSYSAGRFKTYAENAIKDIQDRGKLPVLVGGTGLYLDGVLYDFSFVKTYRIHRMIYAGWSVNKLQKVLSQRDWPLPANLRNRRHLTRALERKGRTGSRRQELPEGVLMVGLMPPDEELKARIASRAEAMFEQGIEGETKGLVAKYGRRKISGTAGIVYKIVLRFLDGEISEEQARELFKTADWQYARRQKTWFKRNTEINWFSAQEEVEKFIKKQLLNT